MKIKSVAITNFKGIKNNIYNPKEKICALIGENGVGKTSFIEAIRFGITGETPNECILSGTKATEIDVILDDGLYFSRIKHREKASVVKVNGKNTTAKTLDTLLEETYGLSKDATKITTSREVFEALTPAQFGDFIMKYIPEEIDFDTVCGYIPDPSPAKITALSTILPSMPKKFDVSLLSDAQSYLFEQRKTLKKEVENRQARISAFTEEKPARSIEDVQVALDALMERKGAQAANKAAIELYNAAVKNKAAAEASLKILNAEIDAIKVTKPLQSEIDEIKKQKDEYRKRIIDASKLIQTISDNLVMFKNTVENLGKPICPLSEHLVCTTDKTKVREELLEIIESNEEGIKIQEEIVKESEAKIAELSKKEEKFAANKAQYDRKVILNARYEQAKKSLPVLPPEPAVTKVENCDDEIAALQKERDAVQRYAAHEQLLEEYAVLREKLDTITSLYDDIQPKGTVMAAITAHYMGVFESVINDRASKLRTGFEIAFSSSDGVRYLVKTKSSGVFYPYENLSQGEQTLAAFLLLDMLNTLCGTKLLFIDDLNHLDKRSAEELITLINSAEVMDSYDHIFVASVNNPDIVSIMSSYAADYPLT